MTTAWRVWPRNCWQRGLRVAASACAVWMAVAAFTTAALSRSETNGTRVVQMYATTAITTDAKALPLHLKKLHSSTGADDLHIRPRVATYRNAYGTHFECTTMCYSIIMAYIVCTVMLLTLLAVIPVQSPDKPEHAPFLLWFGNNHHDGCATSRAGGKRDYTLIDRLSLWLYGRLPHHVETTPEDIKPLHDDVDLLTEAAAPVKTFESIAVETDASLFPSLRISTSLHDASTGDFMVIDDVDKLFDPMPQKSSKKPGIFAPTTPRGGHRLSDSSDNMGSSLSLAPEPITVAHEGRQRAASSPRRSTVGGRRATIIGGGGETAANENVLVAVERRSSMQKRAEKRKEYAKSDIAHENLHEHELHMYNYLEFIRELLEGVAIKKLCQKSSKIVKRTFFITPDLNVVYWNKVGNKAWNNKKSSFETTSIDRVVKGIQGNANLENKGKHEKNDLYVSITMSDGRRLDLEAKDSSMRERLFLGFTRLSMEKREEKRKKDAGEVSEEGAMDKIDIPSAASQEQVAQGEEEKGGDFFPSVDDERRAKTEEDDPKMWGREPERTHANEDSPNQEHTKATEA